MRLGLDEPAWRKPPRPEVVELSVFGPGKGEGLVCHLGNNRWMVLDSCIDSDSSQPVSLDYLDALGVEPSGHVDLVAATHWHDDHIGGLAAVVEAASEAEFHFSMALQSHHFFTLIKAMGEQSMMRKPGAIEFARIVEILEERVREEGRRRAPQPVVAHTYMWRPSGHGPGTTRVEALSPSALSVSVGLEEIAQLLPDAHDPKRRLTSVTPNHTSLVVMLVIGDAVALLGGDMQETGATVHGWSEILASARRPRERAAVIKLAHHGADNGDHPAIWTDLLAEDPVAVLTPFNSGVKPRPSAEDIARICGQAKESYTTTERPTGKRLARDSHTERMLRARRTPVVPASGAMGQVRLRRSMHETTDDWRVELFGSAADLC